MGGPNPTNNDDYSAVVKPPARSLNDEDWNSLVNRCEARLSPDHETLENNLMSPDTNYAVDMYLDIREWVERTTALYNNVIDV